VRDAAQAAGRTITIVSKNSGAAIRKYLGDHRLSDRVRAVFGRNDDPALMNPAPAGPGGSRQPRRRSARVRLHGDSGSDVLAGRLEGVPVIGYPNKPGKAEAQTRGPGRRRDLRLSRDHHGAAQSTTGL
jgi:hypothetical protein